MTLVDTHNNVFSVRYEVTDFLWPRSQ